jgi:hypothetical protein
MVSFIKWDRAVLFSSKVARCVIRRASAWSYDRAPVRRWFWFFSYHFCLVFFFGFIFNMLLFCLVFLFSFLVLFLICFYFVLFSFLVLFLICFFYRFGHTWVLVIKRDQSNFIYKTRWKHSIFWWVYGVLLFLSRLRNSLWLSRILDHSICIVIYTIEFLDHSICIHAIELQVELRFFQFDVTTRNHTSRSRLLNCFMIRTNSELQYSYIITSFY